MEMLNVASSTTQIEYEELTTDELTTTDELLTQIEYNTRMASVGISHIFIIGLVVLVFIAMWAIFKKWYWGGV